MAAQSTISVDAGEHDREGCPVSVNLDEDFGFESVNLTDAENGVIVPAQLDGKTLSWILNDLQKSCVFNILSHSRSVFPPSD